MINRNTKTALGVVALLLAVVVPTAHAAPGAQRFEVYDNTQDGLQVGIDPDTGNVVVNANPGGSDRLIVEVHAQKVAPNCTLSVQLVRDSAASNGGLDASGHTGSIQTLGTLTTNGVGNGNAHFDVVVGDGTPDTAVYGHVDLEDLGGSCTEKDGSSVANNEYGAATDPSFVTPLTLLE